MVAEGWRPIVPRAPAVRGAPGQLGGCLAFGTGGGGVGSGRRVRVIHPSPPPFRRPPPQDWDTWAPAAQYRQRWNKDGTRIKTEQMRKVRSGLWWRWWTEAARQHGTPRSGAGRACSSRWRGCELHRSRPVASFSPPRPPTSTPVGHAPPPVSHHPHLPPQVFGGLPSHNFAASAQPDKARLYSDWIYLRQVHQAVCYDHTISLLRRKMRDPKRASMGSLYWQLNDVWQVRGGRPAAGRLGWRLVCACVRRGGDCFVLKAWLPPRACRGSGRGARRSAAARMLPPACTQLTAPLRRTGPALPTSLRQPGRVLVVH